MNDSEILRLQRRIASLERDRANWIRIANAHEKFIAEGGLKQAFQAGWDAAQRPQMSDTGAPVVVRGPDRTDFEEQFNRYRQKSNT